MVTREKKDIKKSNYKRLYKAICSGCGKIEMLEVPPPIGKKLFCLDCYKK
jgi:hypothetical protein